MDTPNETDAVPGRGTAESAAWFKAQLAGLGMGQTALARFMVDHGDDRSHKAALRTISRMAVGQARVSGEMRVLLTVLRQQAEANLRASSPAAPSP